MLVRSPLLISHKWRELVSSGRLVCRCHVVFLWSYVCFVLLRFRLDAFVEAAALRSIVLRYAGAPIATRVSFLFIWTRRFFRVFVFVPLTLSLRMESTPCVLSFRMVFFYLVTAGWIFCCDVIVVATDSADSQALWRTLLEYVTTCSRFRFFFVLPLPSVFFFQSFFTLIWCWWYSMSMSNTKLPDIHYGTRFKYSLYRL